MSISLSSRPGPAGPVAPSFPRIKIHDTRMLRLMEVLLHGGTHCGCVLPDSPSLLTICLGFPLCLTSSATTCARCVPLLERDGGIRYRLTTKGESRPLVLFSHVSAVPWLIPSSAATGPTQLPTPVEAAFHRDNQFANCPNSWKQHEIFRPFLVKH